MGVICESSIHVFVFECCVKHRHYTFKIQIWRLALLVKLCMNMLVWDTSWNWSLSRSTVQITSNLTFTCACSQNPRKCALCIRGRAYSAHERKYYTCSYARASCKFRARVHCKWKYYMRTYGTNRLSHARAHSYTTREYSYATRECCIDRSWAHAPPSRVKR